MKCKISLLIIICFSTINSFAQWNAKGGIDFSTLSSFNGVKSQTGFHLGIVYDIPISKKMYFQPGLLLTTNGFKFDKTESVKDANISMYALEVPLICSFRPRISNTMKLIADFGLYARYGLWGTKKYVFTDSSTTRTTPFDAYNRLDVGLNLGLGLSYKQLSLTGSYQIGFTNAEKEIANFKHQKYRMSVGYSF